MVSKEENLRDALTTALHPKVDVHIQRHRRLWVKVGREDLREVIQYLQAEMRLEHIALITAADVRENIELNYHLHVGGIVVTLKVLLPKTDTTVPTITDLMPGAVLYEQEARELMGVTVEGHPSPEKRLLLPENWVAGPPMRKDWVLPKDGVVKKGDD